MERDVISLVEVIPSPYTLTNPPVSPRTFLQLGLSFSFPSWQLHLNWSLLHSVKLWPSLVSILKIKSSVDPVPPCLFLTYKPRILASSFVFCYFHLLLTCSSNTCSLASSGPVHPDTVLAKGPNNHLTLNLMHSHLTSCFFILAPNFTLMKILFSLFPLCLWPGSPLLHWPLLILISLRVP